MLMRTASVMVPISLVFAACTARVPESEGSESSSSSADNEETSGASTGVSSTTTASPTTDALTSTSSGGGGADTSTGSESSTGTPPDFCPPGVGANWPQRAAFLRLANEEDFTFGPQDLPCSVERFLDQEDSETLFGNGTLGGLELTCDAPEPSVVYIAVAIPEAVSHLEALVGLEEVMVLFEYDEGSIKTGPWMETLSFAVRDADGLLFLSQRGSCEGQLSGGELSCDLFRPPFQVSPTWSEPLPEAQLADVGCGLRAWEYNLPPAPGTYDMTRLAVRFETDDGYADALDHHITPLNIEGSTYEFFAVEAVGEVDDPAVLFGTNSYTHFARFLITRSP